MHLNAEKKTSRLPSCAILVSTELYANNSNYFSRLKPKIHSNYQTANDACIQCQIDILGKEYLGKFSGTLDPVSGGVSALAFPYTLPENFALVSYIIEAGTLGDDIEEAFLSSDTTQPATDSHETMPMYNLLAGFDQSIRERIEQMTSKIMVHLYNHGEFGETVFSLWNPWQRAARTVKLGQKNIKYHDLDHYFSDRRYDFGWKSLTVLAHFGAGIILNAEEKSVAHSILEPLYDSVILSNDYFSWEVESTGQSKRLMNCVSLFMEWYSLSEKESKELTKAKIIELEGSYFTLKSNYLQKNGGNEVAQNVIDSLELTEAIAAGISLWNTTCPRYHSYDKNMYEAYHRDRVSEGFHFFDSCTESSDILSNDSCSEILSPTNGFDQLAVNRSVGDFMQLAESANSKIPIHFKDTALDPLGLEVLRQPSSYIMAMPGKGVRGAVLNAINLWYQVPREALEIIKTVVKLTHTSSLMFDDVQDNSPLRRGKPSAHTIFGVGQTISSGFFLCLDGFKLVQDLSPPAMSIYLDELDSMHRGQAYDLHWTRNSLVPTEKEYLSMIDAKTSALFRLATRLSRAEATKNRHLELEAHFTLVGRYFQIRDDYQNLTSSEYIDNKGFCEDLDEGKYSLLLIHSLQKGDPLLQNILQQRKISGSLTMEMKMVVLERLKANGSLDYTLSVLKELHELIKKELEDLERRTKTKNWILWQVLHQLKV